ncbi:hypothetical protein M407DRAFT_213194 [Tulasnella calospora MUT 4182]|uniref:RNA-dependent RNA polymerase n=1 Tax=Tulasnella calospora MUT 4182 TaxID=1051891 RepID=A0A0C3Q515_9AGAM|nr:hypothetical protein M407DRAFT_213194 [Tulasnella calospora MUT 4182]
MSQAFTATEPGVNLPVDGHIPILPDIERNNSVFTDGVGEISRALARRIVKSLGKSGRTKRFFLRPSAFQFRMGGCKGVLMVNPELKDNEIRLRASQQKFLSPLADIEIAQVFYRAKPFYLNRFLIMILETLGVPADIFLGLQQEAIRDVEAATESFSDCAEFLDTNGCGTSYHISSVFLHLTRLGLTLGGQGPTAVNSDGFLKRSIRFAKNHVLREMKHRARIPVKESYTLVGVADFSESLPPNTIFACVRLQDQKPFCIKGRVLISRSPQVHPGDVQFVEAIGKPPTGSPFEHERYYNCVVFSTRGDRSVPSMLAGGDLDGTCLKHTCDNHH